MNKEEKLNNFVNKQRNILPHSIDKEDLEELSKDSGFNKEEIEECNQEMEDFWNKK